MGNRRGFSPGAAGWWSTRRGCRGRAGIGDGPARPPYRLVGRALPVIAESDILPAMTNTTAIATTAKAERNTRGQWVKGVSGNSAGNASRARRELNADTIREMHRAFRDGGRAAITKVMRNQPAVFLKLLVLLVPRELEVTHSGGVKAMTDEQLEAGIEAIRAMLAAREAGENAKVIEARVEESPPEDSDTSEAPGKRRTRRKAMGKDMGTTPDEAIS
jgi:hypothetical protein